LLVSFPSLAATLTGNVAKAADGDTITILAGSEQHRIRLQVIDVPGTQVTLRTGFGTSPVGHGGTTQLKVKRLR
jgi:endonuclease YncB( thermonuclease family)